MRRLARSVGILLAVCAVWSGGALAQSSGTRSSSFAYDAASGLLTQEVVEPNTSALRLETDYVYDGFGNKTSVTVKGVDITTRSSSTTYDARGQFVTSNANALGQSESWQYDPRFGSPTSHTGPNGLTTTWSYDTFGRKVLETRADGTQTKWVYRFCSGVNGGTASCLSGASYLIQSTPYASDGVTPNGPTSIVYLDTLDREVGRDTQGFDGSTVRATKAYDSFGRVSQTSRPYFANGGAVELTTFTYDTLGRVITVKTPDGGTSQTAYHGLTVTDTNTLNQTRTVTKNSQGQVVSVTDAVGQTMFYAYDAFGNLIETTDAQTNIVTASYDTRGRKIASNDPDLGNWTYSYDTLGQLISQTDAKGQLTTFSYDLLSRPLQRVEADMTSVWVYDSAANGIGKLASSSITAGPGSGFARSVSYDPLGRPIQVATTISGTTYTMGAGYDANSRLTTVSYPSGFTAKYSYTNLGFANQLQDNASGQSYWTANAIDASGHITQQTSGNGLATTRSFDPATGRLTGISTGSSGAVQNLSYTYDMLGNPLSRSDANTNLSESFVYDSLNRLTQTTVNLSTPLVKAFSYSAIGNMLAKADVGTYNYAAPGSPLPHAVMSTSGGAISATFTYDANGNQTSGLGRNISYTSYNKPSSITQGTQTISFLDDTEHQRFQQVTPSGTTLYIAGFGVLAELSGAGTTAAQWADYLAVGNAKAGMRVLQTASATLSTRYFHTDHLGSVSVITDENGNVLERLSYDAWGKRRFANGTDDPSGSITSQTTRGFTGEEELSTANLVHLNGRVYDTLLARFTSADPTVTDPLNPQGWNRYSYVGNDPLAFTDPNGFSWLSGFFHSVGNFLTHNPIARAILQIGITAILTAVIPVAAFAALGNLAAAAAGASAAFIGSAVTTGLSGGNLSQTLRAGLIAGVTAFAFFGVGELTGHTPTFGTAAYAENVAGHALVGCASAAASGGSCKAGALSGGVTAGFGPLINGQNFAVATVENAVVGGIASVAGGGKFANGAITGAFGYLFNNAAGAIRGAQIGGWVGGAAAGALGVETGPADPLIIAAGRAAGTLLGAAIGDAVTNGDPEDEQTFYRRGPYDTLKAIQSQATAAQNNENIGIFGLSVSLLPNPNYAGQIVRSASQQDILDAGFTITKTGSDPNHFTIGIPNPVTPQVTRTWNDLFK
jgi:RHS repeat-associated protein